MATIPPYFTLFSRLAEGGDVIVLDQRGLGESTPHSDCPASGTALPANILETSRALVTAFADNYRACAAGLGPKALPADFTIDRVADDVDAIAQAIGAPQIDLLGLSFGSRIALEVVKRHASRVRRMVLQAVLGVDTLRAPTLDDRMFTLFAGIAEPQAQVKGLAPSLRQAVRQIQQRAATAPITITIQTVKGETRQLGLGRDVFNGVILGHLGDPNLPAVLTTAANEDYSLLVPWVQSLYQDLEKGAGSLMARVILCSVASPESSRRQAAREAPSTLLGEALDNQMQETAFCQAFGVTPPSSQPGVKARVRTLLISGTHDSRTPPDQAEQTRKGLPLSEHAIVQNGGHELLPMPEVQALVLAFLDDRPERIPISATPPGVRTIEEARKPPRRPGR
jgi:pimeloyl-ACP methyl ester carboxylesterase